jgi:ribonuclease J
VELERIFVDRFKTTPGMVLVACSAQNIDRVVTIYRGAKRTGRTLIVDAYAAEVLKATGYDSIPKPVRGWSKNVAVFIPQAQRVHLVRKNIAPIVDSYRGFRLWPEQLAEHAPRSVMLFRGWMLRDLERAKAVTGARVIWSQWEGYLAEGSGAKLKADCEARGIPFEVIHTSGHASIADLKQLAAAANPKALVPIHTFEAERFPALFDNVILRQDGEWWEV